MLNKKKIFVSICVVLLIILIVAGSTYAYIESMTNEQSVTTGSGELEVVYDISDSITGTLRPTSSNGERLNSVAVARVTTDSVPAAFNLYITPTVIDGLNISALRWEVIGTNGGSTVITKSGNFNGVTANTRITLVDNYNLLTSDTTFNIYIWLDGSMLTSAINNKRFAATITADSVPITGAF